MLARVERKLFDLPSNDGQKRLEGVVRERLEHESGVWLVSAIELSGEFFDVVTWLRDDTVGELAPDFTIALPQIVLPLDAVLELRDALVRWLDDQEPFEVGLAGEAGIELTIALQIRDGWICRRDQPVAVVSYRSHRLDCDARFVVDPSCVRICADTIDAALAE